MIESLVLDLLLILILLLLVPIGMYRGGLREVCSAAGVLLGLLVATQWSARWGDWLADLTGIDVGVSQFVVALGTMVIFGGLIGYGAAASFAYAPGPGGRLYGGLIALLTGVIFLGALIQFVALYLYDDVYPEVIRNGYVSRALSVGFDWVLLYVALAVLLATLFGMVVRERDTEEIMVELPRDSAVRRPVVAPVMAPEPITLEPQAEAQPVVDDVDRAAQVKIREVRHWEEATPPTAQELKSGWTRTWPSSVTTDANKVPWDSAPTRSAKSAQSSSRPKSSPDEAVIRDWLAEDQRAKRPPSPPARPIEDE